MESGDGLRTMLILPSIQGDFAKSKHKTEINLICSIANLVFKNDDRYKINPGEILIDAVAENREIGSCTCVLASLDE